MGQVEHSDAHSVCWIKAATKEDKKVQLLQNRMGFITCPHKIVVVNFPFLSRDFVTDWAKVSIDNSVFSRAIRKLSWVKIVMNFHFEIAKKTDTIRIIAVEIDNTCKYHNYRRYLCQPVAVPASKIQMPGQTAKNNFWILGESLPGTRWREAHSLVFSDGTCWVSHCHGFFQYLLYE